MNNGKNNYIDIVKLNDINEFSISNLITNLENSFEVQQSLSQEILIDKILSNPYKSRKNFNNQQLKELSKSIKTHGLIQPIIVSKINGTEFYQLIVGERRKIASKMLGLKVIKAIIIEATQQQIMEFSLIENIQRVNLNAFEEAQSYRMLIDKMKWTHGQLAKKVNKSRPHISNTLRILDLPVEVLKMVKDNKLTMGHVRPLLQLMPNVDLIVFLANYSLQEKLNVRKVESLVKNKLLEIRK